MFAPWKHLFLIVAITTNHFAYSSQINNETFSSSSSEGSGDLLDSSSSDTEVVVLNNDTVARETQAIGDPAVTGDLTAAATGETWRYIAELLR